MARSILLGLLFLFLSLQLQAQLFVDTMYYAPEDLIMDFFQGSCVDILSVEYNGESTQSTFFEGSQSGLGINAGIILATGAAAVAVGPNNVDNAAMGFGNTTPDPLIQAIANGGSSFDRCKYHLQLIPHTDSIGFKYVFGSEEYCEYVGSQFNDVFGFWIQGPGFPDPTNIALIPNPSAIPVSINNVNNISNSDFYINNTPATGVLCASDPATGIAVDYVQFDGLTTVLTAYAQVVPDSSYDIWIAVSDISDGIYDSGVFLSVESLCGDSLLSPIAAFNTISNGNTVSFSNATKYATKWHWNFGDGSTSDERFPTHEFPDLLGQTYQVSLVASNYCCSDTSLLYVGTSASGAVRETGFKVYPTHFQDELRIEVPGGNFGGGWLSLYNVTGIPVLQQRLDGNTLLQTGHLPAGVYTLTIKSATGAIWTGRVIK